MHYSSFKEAITASFKEEYHNNNHSSGTNQMSHSLLPGFVLCWQCTDDVT